MLGLTKVPFGDYVFIFARVLKQIQDLKTFEVTLCLSTQLCLEGWTGINMFFVKAC